MSLARAAAHPRADLAIDSGLIRATTRAISRAKSRAETRAPSWGRSPGSGAWFAGLTAVFLVALAARVLPVLRGRGYASNLGYDAGVYYAAGDGLVHGRLPYRDFVLLHPPGVMLALAPFAAIGRLTSDHVGFVLACLGFTAIGAVNAALVMMIARKLGTSAIAAFGAGLFAAVWIGSIRAEYLTRLEPLANLFVLIGLYAYAAARSRPTTWSFALMGAALATATAVKIWYAVPLIVMAGWVLLGVRRRRAAVAFAAGTGLALLAIVGPFAALAPTQMWHMVITDQLGRRRITGSPLTRLDQTVDLSAWNRALGPWAGVGVVAVLLLILGFLSIGATRRPGGRLLVVLLSAQVLVLITAPSWFSFYSDYLTPALAVSVALGLDGVLLGTWRAQAAIRHRHIERPVSAATALVGLAVLVAPLWWQHVGLAFPRVRLAAAVASTPCVMADTPMALIELDALSRSFSSGCRDWVDITGRTYGADHMNASRPRNTLWQHDIRAYLLSGNAFIFIRDGTGLSARTRAELRARPVLARSGPFVIYEGRSAARGSLRLTAAKVEVSNERAVPFSR